MLNKGTKVDLAYAQKGSTTADHIAGIIWDQRLDQADGANGPIGQVYEIIVLQQARPENGGHKYLTTRKVLVDSWSLAIRKYEVPELDNLPLDDLYTEMMSQRQEAHIRRIQSQEAAAREVAESVEALPF